MRQRDIKGRAIRSVSQERFWCPSRGRWYMAINSIEFEDGASLALHAIETENEPIVGATFFKAPKQRKP